MHKTAQPYEEKIQFSFVLNRKEIKVVSKPGLPDWNQLLPATELLAEFPEINPTDHILLFSSHHGALGVYYALCFPNSHITILDPDFIALEMTHLSLEANNLKNRGNITVSQNINMPDLEKHSYDIVLMQIPKGRILFRRWLLQAEQALSDMGRLYIAGSNKAGIASAIKDASELFPDYRILGYKKGNRIAHFTRKQGISPIPEWAILPGIAPGSWVEFKISLNDRTFQIRSLPGVFSFDRLDTGTELLINVVKIDPGARVLDVGCGYGIIGMFAASHGAAQVDLIDNNIYAIASSKANLELNQITNAAVYAGDLLAPVLSKKYNLILSNPPFHAGHAVDYQVAQGLITQAYQALVSGGQLILVANRFLPYDRAIREVFGNVSTLSISRRFHVISGLKYS